MFHVVLLDKARQLGITWTVSGGYGLWKANFHSHTKVMDMSQGQEEAYDMIDKAEFIWDNLPTFLQAPRPSPSKDKLDFPDQHSEIKALPSTEKAGHGTDATLVMRDELAFHPFAAANFGAISPSIDSGGQLIDFSKMDKTDPTNHFTERVHKAYEGSIKTEFPSGLVLCTKPNSDTALVFLGWRLRPVRQENMTLEEFHALRLVPNYTKLQLEENYPETLEQSLSIPESTAFFDGDALQDMQLNISHQLSGITEINTWGGIVKVWKKPVVGRRYVVFTDPADGYDPFATIVMDARSFEWVATGHGLLKAEQCAVVHDSLVRWYNIAYNSLEVNSHAGGKAIATLNELKTPSQAPRRDINGNVKMRKGGIVEYGWWTSDPLRDIMLRDYEQAVRARLLTVHDKEAIDEHKEFIRLDGKLQARKGRHDDYVMAGAGAWQLQKHILVVASTQMKSYEYRRS